MTLLSTAQEVAAEIGLAAPPSLIGSSNPEAMRFLAASKAAGQDIYRSHNWTALHREYTFDTEADEPNYPVPDDFGRMIPNTAWDRDRFWSMPGNTMPAEWQYLKSALIASPGLRRFFRVVIGPLAGSLLIHPTPTAAGETLVFEYVSRNWCETSAGTGQATWAADADLFRLDGELYRLAVLWRAKRNFGLEYADERLDYERELRRQVVADLALPVVNMCRPLDLSQPRANVPETGFGS